MENWLKNHAAWLVPVLLAITAVVRKVWTHENRIQALELARKEDNKHLENVRSDIINTMNRNHASQQKQIAELFVVVREQTGQIGELRGRRRGDK